MSKAVLACARLCAYLEVDSLVCFYSLVQESLIPSRVYGSIRRDNIRVGQRRTLGGVRLNKGLITPLPSEHVGSSMESLNLGSGLDPWGTVRLDMARTWAGEPGHPTVIADAHYLPFRDKAFTHTRCWHTLEHLRDPHAAFREIVRVSESADVRFPTESFLQRAVESANLRRHINHRRISKKEPSRTMGRYTHLWAIHPRALGVSHYQIVKHELFSFLRSGRKAKLFRKIFLPRVIPYEWVVTYPNEKLT
jgi:methyltransferase family protein